MEKIIENQRKFFNTDTTKNVEYRLAQLKILKEQIHSNYSDLISAFKKDYNKCEFDVVATEIGLVLHELNFMIKNIKKLSKPKRVRTSLINFKSKGIIYPEPFGVTLIVAPWNYPFQLSFIPLIGAIATGNTIVIKPSSKTPNISNVIDKILSVFDKRYIYVSFKNKSERDIIFDQKYDFVFYTGSSNIAKNLMERQSKYLTPMVLELGGKSPLIVDKDANIDISAKRGVWGKFLNAGQTCVAPDYFCVHKSILNEFIERVEFYINKYYYTDGVISSNFPYIINEDKAKELLETLSKNDLVCGGKLNGRLLEPTVIKNVSFNDEIMQSEIFGSVMPIIAFEDIDDLIDKIKSKEKPLAFYYFGKENESKVLNSCSFGGGCINDCIMHLTESKLPFGGVGNSGMGSYHGKKSFEVLSHYKSVLKKSEKCELNTKYPPYTKGKLRLMKFIFKIKNKK